MTSNLRNDYEQAKAEARVTYQRLAEQARVEARPLSDNEKATVQAALTRVQALERRVTGANGDDAMQTQIDRLLSGMATTEPGGGNSLGAQFVASAAGKWLRETRNRGSHWETPVVELMPPGFGLMSATLTEGGVGGAPVPPQYLPGIVPTALRPPVVADLLGAGTTTSNALVYMRETLFTNAAAAVAEGGLKPESTITFESVTDSLVKIAHHLPVTDELLEDLPAMRAYIDTRLMQGVQVQEDSQLLSGSGVAPNMLGLLNRAGLAPAVARGTDSNEVALAKQMAAIAVATNLVVSGCVLNPANWLTIQLAKDTVGGYYGSGPFDVPRTPTLWGKPVALTTGMAAGTALVVCGTAAMVFRKGGINVLATNSHADDFIHNLQRIRAEERIALAVMVPAAFGTVTGLN